MSSRLTTTASIVRQFADNAIATVGCAWIYCLFTLIDGVFVARFLGSSSLAVIALALPFLYIPYAINSMLGVGASTLMARALGEGKIGKARLVFSQTILICLAAGAALAFLVHFLAPAVIGLISDDALLNSDAVRFVRLSAYFSPFLITAYTLEFSLRLEGVPGYGLRCLATVALLNVVLDYLCLSVWHTSLDGVAISTGICHLLAAVVMLRYHFLNARLLKPVRSAFRLGWFVNRIMIHGATELTADLGAIVTIAAFNVVISARLGARGLSTYAILEYLGLFITTTWPVWSTACNLLFPSSTPHEKQKV